MGANNKYADPVERFWSHVQVAGPDDCWPWSGYTTKKGYGRVQWNGEVIPAHRVAFELTYGAVPPGLVIDHLCRVRNCMNAVHMEAVTNEENIRRGLAHGVRNGLTRHCPSGHEYTEENTRIDTRGVAACRLCNKASVAASRKRKAQP